jgi:sulfonate transport system substrate-binding protein
VLNAREDFIAKHPDLVQTVVNAYERARQWIENNPDQAIQLYARESKVSAAVAKVVLSERTRLNVDPVPGSAQRTVLQRIAPVLVADGNVKSADAASTALDTLFDTRYAEARSSA